MTIAINDPSLPSYHAPVYQAMVDDWNFVGDMYQGRRAWLKTNGELVGNKSSMYLPIEPDEENPSYSNRLRRSSFQRRYGNAIDAFAGILSRFSVTGNLPNGLTDYIDDNVDRLGSSLSKFLIQADISALRDGICYILVDFPQRPVSSNGREMTYLEEKELNLRPFLTLYDARQIVNLQIDGAGQQIELVSIRELTWERHDRFGTKMVEKYRVLFPGGGELYRVVEIKGKESLQLESSWESTASQITLVPYSIGIGSEGIFGVQPPLLDLALLNLKHYQKDSEKDELMHKCNIPILQINRAAGLPKAGSTGANTRKEEPKVTIGPNTVLWNAEARYVEPTGAALSLTMQDLRELEAAMTQKTLDFLTLGDVSRTATEIVHSAAPLSASLAGMIVAKETAVKTIFDYWQIFGGGNSHTATIQIDEGAIRSTINSANIDRLMTLRQNKDISQKTFLKLIQEARVLPISLDIDQEIAMIAAENMVAMPTQSSS
jgi:Domain of unknown function (DUF4055)